jgi:hypothetical protein
MKKLTILIIEAIAVFFASTKKGIQLQKKISFQNLSLLLSNR